MLRRPPRSTRTDTLFPYTTLFPISNVHRDAVEHRAQDGSESLVFMHAVKDGPADRSFGLQVAALAGLPKAVIAQARSRLAELERHMRSEEHTSELQSLMRISYAVFCLKKNTP